MATQVALLLNRLRRITASPSGESVADPELLRRFVRSQDHQAFAVLVKRHGPLVMRTCKRVLGDPEGAEDAFQATFLVLARKAHRLARPAALAGWLHGVACRVAKKAVAQRARGTSRLQSLPADVYPPAASADPLAELTARELMAIVDEEIARLPEKFRLPVILCCLEGQTQQEAAQQLGWSAGSVKGPLDRGRARLHARLTQRGLALSLALAAIEVSRGAALAVSSALADATARAICALVNGSPTQCGLSPVAVEIAHQALQDMAVAKPQLALWAAAFVAIVGSVTLAVCSDPARSPSVPPMDPPQGTKALATINVPMPVADAAPGPVRRITLEGQIVDSMGKPVPRAQVYLREQPFSWTASTGHPTETRNIAQTASDADGRFVLREVALPPSHFLRTEIFPLDIVVHASGFALAWRHLEAAEQGRGLRIALAPEAQVQGRLIDAQGKPVAGAPVKVAEVARLDQEKMAWLGSPGFVDLRWSHLPLTTRTDAEGRFVLRGLPADARIALAVSDPRYVRQEILVATSAARQPPLTYRFGSKGPLQTATVHQSPFTAALEPGFRLRMQVLLDDTGKPAVGARWVEPPILSPPDREVDGQGRLALDHLPRHPLRLRVYPPEASDYLGLEMHLDFEGQPRLLEPTVRLQRGVIVQGRVVEQGTNKGVPGAELQYLGASGEYPRPFAWRTGTDAQGRFRLAVPPGAAKIVLLTVPPGYQDHELRSGQSMADAGPRFLRSFEASPKVTLPSMEFTLNRGIEVTGQAIAPDGKPTRLTRFEALLPGPHQGERFDASIKPAGGFHLSALKPETRYRFGLIAGDDRLAATVELNTPKAGEKVSLLHVKLSPMASLSGRVVDEDGKPILGAVVRLRKYETTRAGQTYGSVTGEPLVADMGGRFTFRELLPGIEYSAFARADDYAEVTSDQWKAKAAEAHTLPDLQTIKADQVVAGILVDPAGQPLPGIAVSASYDGVRARVSSEPSLTDLEGRFRLSGLPRGNVQLSALLTSAQGNKRVLLLQSVLTGQKSLRMVLDANRQ